MLTSLVSLLPAQAQPYAKALAATLLSLLTVLSSTLEAVPSWVTILLAVLTAPAVYATPNVEPAPVDDAGPLPDAAELPLDEL